MFRARTFCKASFAAVLFFAFFTCLTLPFCCFAESNVVDAIGEFLKRTPLSVLEQEEIETAIKASPSQGKTEWVLTGDDTVYSIVLFSIKSGSNANAQLKLEEAARLRAETKTKYLLLLWSMPETQRKHYIHEDSMANALMIIDNKSSEDKRLKMLFTSSIVDNGWAFAVAAAKKDGLMKFREFIQSKPETFDAEYCKSLYPDAKSLFQQKDYVTALKLYLDLHRLKWGNPMAYLEAAECFLRTGDTVGAMHLILQTEKKLYEKMESSDFEYAGDLLLEMGDEKSAELFYRKAIQKMRTGE